MCAKTAWLSVPEHLRGGLARYLLAGIMPGSFLQAFLDNDLVGAIARADEPSLAGFRPLTQFLHNYCPRGAYGHAGCYQHWRSISTVARINSVNRECGEALALIIADSGLDMDSELALERAGG